MSEAASSIHRPLRRRGAGLGLALCLLCVAFFATFTYGVGLLAAQQRSGGQPTVATAAAVEVEARMSAMSGAAKKQAGRTARSMWSRIRSRDEPPAPH